MGTTFELDITDNENPKVLNKPEKTAFVYELSTIPFMGESSIQLQEGRLVDIKDLSHCYFGANLVNESGFFISHWGDKTIPGKVAVHWTERGENYPYKLFITCELYNQAGFCNLPKHPADLSTGSKD